MSTNRKPPCLNTKNKLFAESAARINDVLSMHHSRCHYSSCGLGKGYHAGISISLMTWSMIGKTTDNDSGAYTFVDMDQYFFEMADLLQ